MSWDVTGMGVVSPLGSDPATFFDAVCAGRDARARLRHFDARKFRMRHAYQIVEQGPREPTLRATRWLCAAVCAALADAGLNEDPSDIPVLVGTTLGEQRSAELWWHRGDPLHAADLDFGAALRRGLGIRLSYTFANACGAALYALGLAADRLAADEFGTVVVAGTDVIAESTFAAMDRVQNESPQEVRPFDVSHTGMVMGEGAVAVVLQQPTAAAARRVHTRLLGVGLNCDAHHPTAPDPAGITDAIRQAHRLASVAPADIDLVMAHGTGTPRNDETEAAVLASVFSGAPSPLVTALKSATGHTLGGSGLLSFVTAALALQRGVVPPVAGLTTPLPEAAALRLVRDRPVAATLRRAQANAFGFGGINAVAVLERP